MDPLILAASSAQGVLVSRSTTLQFCNSPEPEHRAMGQQANLGLLQGFAETR